MIINKIPLAKKIDERGWLAENANESLRKRIKHFFVSVTYPGKVRGQHYHKRKREWFLVLNGKAKISFKNLKGENLTEIVVSGNKLELVEVSPMIAHAIQNIGKDKMELLALVNEPLDKDNPDTFAFKVI